ncbi:MAG: dipeptide ABC transporter ATP-binding protein [Clostridiales bacterium]|nr:dipeptide ABC transporter ATP-binding protein [Clostridiales bacterium]
MATPILELKQLQKHFDVTKGLFSEKQIVKAVNGIDLRMASGETFGLVGESGCGKTTLGRTVIKLYEPTGGRIIYRGQDITDLNAEQMLPYRKKIQMIFQDPYASLNPRFTVGEIIREPMEIHNLYTPKERGERVQQLLQQVGLAADHIRRYPHEFSGGQRQRIGIARTLALDPEFVICDEPISALDVSIQAQIINLLERLQAEFGISYLFIAHDLSMVKHISDRIGVMYLGHMVEYGESVDLYKNPLHPYTRALLSAVPTPDPRTGKTKKRILLEGELPSPLKPPSGCPFRTRCRETRDLCSEQMPELKELGGRMVACHLY